MSEEYFHPKLKCCVRSINYNFDKKTGCVYMGDIDCVDMSGCIEIFVAIDERVERIFTFQGDRTDTSYFKVHGKWKAVEAD